MIQICQKEPVANARSARSDQKHVRRMHSHSKRNSPFFKDENDGLDTEADCILLQQQRLWNPGQSSQHLLLDEGQAKNGDTCRRWWDKPNNMLYTFSPASRAGSCLSTLDQAVRSKRTHNKRW